MSSDVPAALPTRVKFGKFQLVARLGKGGMGDVFLASAAGIEGVNKLVVIKKLRDTFAEDPHMRSLFLAEGKLAARLNHPNVVQTNEVGEEGEILYLCMEYLEGQPLNDINRKFGTGPVDPVIMARIVSEALAGLHYAHELVDYEGTPLKLVHRDVSPHNIFVTYDGATKVLDFGIAKVTSSVQNKTQEGILKGKVAYMAPEQVSGEFDRRADVFSAGIVLWELIARKRLMAEASVAQTLYRVVNRAVPRLSSVVPTVDPMLDEILARALEKSPADRYQTAQEMRDALEGYIASTGRFVRQEDLAKVMAKFFTERRARIREQVKTFMAAAAQDESSIQDLPAVGAAPTSGSAAKGDSSQFTPTSTSALMSVTGATAQVGSVEATLPAARSAPPVRKRRNVGLWAAAALAGGVAVAIIVPEVRSHWSAAPSVPPPETASAAPPDQAASPSKPAEPTPAAAATETGAAPVVSATATPARPRGRNTRPGPSVTSAAPPAPPEVAPPPSPATAAPTTSGKRKFRTEF